MNIGIFTECYHPTMNGVVVSIDTFRRELERMGHKIYVFAPRSSDPQFKETDDRVFRLPSMVLPGRAFYPIIQPWTRLDMAALADLDLDIIHTQHIFTAGVLARRASRTLGVPLISTYHTLIAEYGREWLPWAGNMVKEGLIRWSRQFCNSIDQLVTPSQPMKEVLFDYGIKTPIAVIPTGIELADYQIKDRRPLLAKYHLSEDQKILLYVGRIAIEKNLLILFQTFEQIIKDYPDSHLVLVGSGPDENHLQQLSRQKGLTGKITFTGMLAKTEANRFFAAADIFTFPSITDTQGIVIAEAMAGGAVPVAMAKLGPLDIINDGKNGLLVNPNQLEGKVVAEFVKKISHLLKNQKIYAKLRQQAAKDVRKFSAGACAEKMNNLYEEIKHRYSARFPTKIPVRQG